MPSQRKAILNWCNIGINKAVVGNLWLLEGLSTRGNLSTQLHIRCTSEDYAQVGDLYVWGGAGEGDYIVLQLKEQILQLP